MSAHPLLPTGTMLAERYRIVKMMGRGGFGAVYKAWDTRLNSPCAVKENFETTPEAERQFAREASLLAGMRHPNLPVMIDHFIIPGQGQYLVMDFVAGDDLQSILEKNAGPLDEAQVLPWFTQVCDGLNYLHSRKPPVIHRDLKPANVRITPDGDAMLVDFGIAKSYDPSTKTTMGARAVTPGYSPPEQYGFGSTDSRSDLYALGATLYTLLTGQMPVESVQRTVGIPLPPPTSLNPHVSRRVEAIILKAMALLPADRYQTAAEFKAALVKAQAPAPLEEELQATVTLQTITTPEPVAQPMEAVAEAMPIPTIQAPRARLGRWIGLGALVLIVVIGAVLAISRVVGGQATSATGTAYALAANAVTPSPSRTRVPTRTATLDSQALILPDTPTPSPTSLLPTDTPTPTLTPELPVLAQTSLPLERQAISAVNAESLELVARWGRGTIEEIAWSEEGSLVAVAGSIGVFLYDSVSFDTLAYFETGSWAYTVAISPDGAYVAAGLEDSTVRVWQVSDQTLLLTLEGHAEAVWSVAFSPDGNLLGSGSADSDIILWNMPDGSLSHRLNAHLYGVRSIAFSPDGLLLASGSDDNTIRLWNLPDGSPVSAQMGHLREVYSVAFSPDSSMLASGSQDDTLRLWDVAEHVAIDTLEGHTGDVNAVAFSPDGSMVASASSDGTTRLWQVSDQSLIRRSEGQMDAILGLAFSPDGTSLASGVSDGTLRLWQVPDGTTEQIFDGLGDAIYSIDFTTDGTKLAVGYADGKIRLWDTTNGEIIRVLSGHTDVVNSVDFSPDDLTLVSGSSDTTIRMWRVADGVLLRMIEGHTDKVTSVAFSPDGTRLASASWDGWLRLWYASDGAPIYGLAGGIYRINSISFSPFGNTLASGSEDYGVRLWRVLDGVLLNTMTGHGDVVTQVVYSPVNEMVASASIDDTVRVWDCIERQMTCTLRGNIGDVSTLAFSMPDGALLGTGTTRGLAQLWQVGETTVLHELGGHTSAINQVAFSPDGTLFATASMDGTIRIWGVP